MEGYETKDLAFSISPSSEVPLVSRTAHGVVSSGLDPLAQNLFHHTVWPSRT